MRSIRDHKKFKIYMQTVLSKHTQTITNYLFNSYVTGLYELNKILKDYQNMKFVMKMKSEMESEKSEEDKLFGKEPANNVYLKNNRLGNLKIDKKNKIPNPRKNFESNNSTNSNRDTESITSYDSRKGVRGLNDAYIRKAEIPVNSGYRSIKSLNEKETQNKKKISNANNNNIENSPIYNHSHTITNIHLMNPHNEKENTLKKLKENIRENENPTNSQLNKKLFDPRITKADFNILKDNETIQSTTVTPTENSDYDVNNSRRYEQKNSHSEINFKRGKHDSKNLKEILTDDLTEFPNLRLPSQKNANSISGEEKKLAKDSKNNLILIEVDVHQKINSNHFDKNSTKNKNNPQNFNYVLPDNKNNKNQELPDNKLAKSVEIDFKNNTKFINDRKKPKFALIESPIYGTISFIAQKYVKIEIDEWRADF